MRDRILSEREIWGWPFLGSILLAMGMMIIFGLNQQLAYWLLFFEAAISVGIIFRKSKPNER